MHFIVLSLLVCLLVCGCSDKGQEAVKSQAEATQELAKAFSTVVETLIADYETQLDKTLELDAIRKALFAANTKSLSLPEITALDNQWRESKETDSMVRERLINDCANQLVALEEQYPAFIEIFVTGRQGLNVCQTNMTSDFYQADEEWWQKAFAEGAGKRYHGEIEHDDSAGAEVIPIYIPLYAEQDRKVIGVVKALLSVTRLKAKLIK